MTIGHLPNTHSITLLQLPYNAIVCFTIITNFTCLQLHMFHRIMHKSNHHKNMNGLNYVIEYIYTLGKDGGYKPSGILK